MSIGDEAALVGGEGGGGEELAVLGEARAGAAVSVPVGPATVHILNQVRPTRSSQPRRVRCCTAAIIHLPHAQCRGVIVCITHGLDTSTEQTLKQAIASVLHSPLWHPVCVVLFIDFSL